ncbi:MAG: PSD1 and planctomycete cytochrome C domain-containing protein [Deltaproteobacteria bacterium]
MSDPYRHFRVSGALFVVLTAVDPLRAADPPAFERDVRPILKTYCLDCHGGGEKLEGNLDLRLRRFAVKGGDGGPAIVPGDAAGSLLIERMKAGEMPPTEKKVPADRIAVVEQWIAAGASVGRNEPESLPPGIDITPEERAFWSFQPIRRPEPPRLENTVASPAQLAQQPGADLVRTPIDAFILARLREKGLRFAPDADRLALIRRAAFDLIGLPPTPAQIDEFLNDQNADAYEKMLDRLLQSPQYGERWGRHWLDVAGYADSEGNGNEDTPRPYAYKYRDYVIRSLNADKPLDQFVIEQLAGDELVPPPWNTQGNNLTPEQIEKLTATGFLRMAVDGTATGGGDLDAAANLVVADTIKIVSSALLGLSVGCAQCHDHKYDPIPQSDYFRLRAVLEPALDPSHWRRPAQRLVSLYTDADRAKAAAVDGEVQAMQTEFNAKQAKYVAAALEKELEKFPEDQRGAFRDAYNTPGDKRSDAQKKLLADHPSVNISPGVLYQYNKEAADELKKDQEKINARRSEKPVEDFLSVTNEIAGTLPATHLFHRGDYRQPKQAISPGDLTIAAPEGNRVDIAEKDPNTPTSGRRLALARHLMSGKHPLVGRVLANRIWLHHFGRGIVETPGDFGMLGVRPTHPELLDWLADEFVRQGWSLKRMHRLIMNSAVYRQSSVAVVSHVPGGRASSVSRRSPNALPLDGGGLGEGDEGPKTLAPHPGPPPQRGEGEKTIAAAEKPEAPVDPRRIDSENAFYWHFPLRRLEAEVLRDRMLAASGRLDATPFGPAVPVEENFAGQVMVKEDKPRRSVYLQVRRTKPVSFLTTFDAPVMTVNCERRTSSTGAVQSLMLMNNESVLKEAEHFAQRLRRETPADFAKDLAALLAAKYPRPNVAWQFGYGNYDEAAGRVGLFAALPHFTGSAWQGGAALPDPALGWVILHGAGGHAGNDQQHAAIRRWTAPAKGILTITGKLKHPSENGDGVRGRIVSSRQGLLGEWSVKTRETETPVPNIEVEAGDTIDFVTDCAGDVTSDSFEWGVQLKLADAPGRPPVVWDSAADFHGPLGVSVPQQIAYAWRIAYQRPIAADELELACQFVAQQTAHLRSIGEKSDHELAALTSLCQQLFSSNEFLHVD